MGLRVPVRLGTRGGSPGRRKQWHQLFELRGTLPGHGCKPREAAVASRAHQHGERDHSERAHLVSTSGALLTSWLLLTSSARLIRASPAGQR
jgi:hypothetical protein